MKNTYFKRAGIAVILLLIAINWWQLPSPGNTAADKAPLAAGVQPAPDSDQRLVIAPTVAVSSTVTIPASTSFDYTPGPGDSQANGLPFWKDYESLRVEEMYQADSEYVQNAFRQLAEKRAQRLATEGVPTVP